MVTLRCTQKLLRRLKVNPPRSEGEPSSTRLGDWCANLLFTQAGQVVLFVNEKSFLPVVVSAKDGATLWPRFPIALHEVLAGVGVPEVAIDAELSEMQDFSIARTSSRQVVGVLTELAFHLQFDLAKGMPYVQTSVRLADTPCSPLYKTYIAPNTAARELLALPKLTVLQ